MGMGPRVNMQCLWMLSLEGLDKTMLVRQRLWEGEQSRCESRTWLEAWVCLPARIRWIVWFVLPSEEA